MSVESGVRPSAVVLARAIGTWDSSRDTPAYRNLAHGIRAAVLDGRITLDTRLPSERDLAVALSVSRTTVAGAFSLLRDSGWIRSRRGSGSVVQLPDDATVEHSGLSPFGPVSYWGAPVPTEAGMDLIDLTTASLPAPLGPLRLATDAAVDALPTYAAGSGYFPLGLAPLRTRIAERYCSAGLPTTEDQILVTNGAQHALSTILLSLTGIGDRVLVESPTYPVALDAIRSRKTVPTPVGLRALEDSPWDADLICTTMRQSAPALAYLQPDFHNPTGALMSAATRLEVLAAARTNDVMVVIDESLREVPFGDPGDLPPHFACGDADGRVISIGSLSKSVWGGLRIGWIRTTPNLVSRLAGERAMGDMAGSVLDQLVALHLLMDPDAALSEQRGRLMAGHAALVAALDAHAPHWIRTHPAGGATVWLQLPGPVATEAARLAPRTGVRIVPGPRFGPGGMMDSYLRLPFTAAPERLTTAVPRVVAAVEAASHSRGQARPDNWLT